MLVEVEGCWRRDRVSGGGRALLVEVEGCWWR